MIDIKEKWNRYKNWQKQPYQVAPMSDEEHVCPTCSTDYTGNFCPRCGQSAKVVPKMSLLKTFLLFLDVWGLGNRGMFRTLRDLIFRPGYLIRDYLRGMHGAYFPPFKLLFLLTTLSLIIGHGWNLTGENYDRDFTDEEKEIMIKDRPGEDPILEKINREAFIIRDFQKDYPALFQLTFMLFTCGFFYLYFRKTRTIGTLSFHEFFIAQIYISNMVNIYTIVMRFFGLSALLIMFVGIMYIIPLKQLTGYTWRRTIWRYILTILTVVLVIVVFMIILTTYVYIVYDLPSDDVI